MGKELGKLSESSYYRRKKKLAYLHYKRNHNNFQSENNNYQEEQLEINYNQPSNISSSEFNNDISTYELESDLPSKLNQNYQSNTSSSEFNNDISTYELESDLINEITNHKNLISDIQVNLDDYKVIDKLLEFYIEDNSSINLISKIIDLLNDLKSNDNQNLIIPKSFYQFKQFFDVDIKIIYYFVTKCCNINISNFKSLSKIFCSNCDNLIKSRKVLSQRKYFFRFIIRDQIKILLDSFELDYNYPGSIFRHFLHIKKNICSLTLFIDDAPSAIKRSNYTNLFLKINNLKSNLITKTFLNSCYVHPKKLNDNELIFFLNDFVEEVNYLYDNGIFIEKYNKIIYPVITQNLFDMVARHQLLFHINFNGFYGCLRCLNKGESCKCGSGSNFIYVPNTNAELRTIELHDSIFRLIQNGQPTPILGIKSKSPLTNIYYQNYLISTTNEPMHLISGIFKRNCESILNSKDSLCYLNSNHINLIEKRINKYVKFTYNCIFKRKPNAFRQIENWKTNQIFQFLFFMFPVIFENVLDNNVFLHNIILICITSELWSKDQDQIDIRKIDNLIKLYTELIEHIYSKSDLIPNNHQLEHLIEQYLNHGKFSLNNAFLFEHYNGIIKKTTNSSYGILEQVSEKSKLLFKNNINKELNKNSKKREFSTKEKKSNKINKIYNDYLFITTSENKNASKDYYVSTFDNRYFKILNFFKASDDRIFCTANEFEITGSFSMNLEFSLELNDKCMEYLNNLDDKEINLDYILVVNLLDRKIEFDTNKIKEKVLYCPNFYFLNHNFLNTSKGLIFKNIIEFYN